MMIKQESEVDIFIASKIGSFKHVKYYTDPSKNNKKCIENLVEIKSLQKDDSVTCMQWGNVEQTEILLGRKNQQIQVYNTVEGFKKTYTADFAPGHVVGLGCCKRKLLAAVSSGVVRIWSKKQEYVVETGGKLDRMAVCGDEPTIFGTGGEENDLKIWTIGEPTPTFAAKNLANDWLQLRRPVWVADLVFLPGDAGKVAAVCSRHGYVRLYDSRAQRRPVCNVEFPNMAATCITTCLDNRQVVVGFGRGQLHQVDLRKARPDKGYKGCAGAVASAAVARGLLVSASLDRNLRVHDLNTKQLLYKQYLTSKLSSVLLQTVTSTPLLQQHDQDQEIKEEEDVPDPDELDQLFEDMETVGQVVVGFGRGQLHQVDLRKARPDKGYKGCAGAVASAAVARGLLVSASLDRNLRVHDLNTKQLLYKQYLTSKLSSVLLQTVTSTPLLQQHDQDQEIKEEEDVPDPDELDQLFEDMETVGDKPKKKQPDEPPAKKIKPSAEGSTIELEDDEIEETPDQSNPEEAIVKLLRSTEKQKRRIEKKKKEKKAKSVFHNA